MMSQPDIKHAGDLPGHLRRRFMILRLMRARTAVLFVSALLMIMYFQVSRAASSSPPPTRRC